MNYTRVFLCIVLFLWQHCLPTHECPIGYYGANCSSKCSPGCVSPSCNRKTGVCIPSGRSYCKPGWRHSSAYYRCDKCDTGKYGVDCAQNCSSGCSARRCNSSSGVCLDGRCKKGWTNTDPQLQRCDQECPIGYYGANCSSKCSPGCVSPSCNRKTGVCIPSGRSYCKPGWRHSSAYYRCDKCDTGKYGVDCAQNCSSGCSPRECDSSSGVCLYRRCKDGWTNTDPQLQRCDQECPIGYYGANCSSKCSPGCVSPSCNRKTGVCIPSGRSYCKPGWRHSSAYYRCDKCDTGKYGVDCAQNCSSGCSPRECDSSSGVCLYRRCKDGWTNTDPQLQRCDQECSDGFYVNGQACTPCGSGCSGECYKTDGHCSCKTGWTGTHCNECGAGYYTDRRNCVKCGTGCESGTCERNTGNCRCKAGWTGARCTQCGAGYYTDRRNCVKCGTGCESGTCERNTGNCRCKAGWTGARCTQCVAGYYTDRRNCVKCGTGCESGTCERNTGNCRCKAGWTGARCTQCGAGYYTDRRNCVKCGTGCESGTCERNTGNCRCKAGWTGARCTQCGAGYYTDRRNCVKCGTGCESGTCERNTGNCRCKAGWTGARCTQCGAGYYTDRRNCVKCGTGCESGTCERNTGNCRCKAGWTGARCTQCGAGYYTDRRNCVKCGTGCESGTCERNTGNCRCKAGWTGARCTQCGAGYYTDRRNCVKCGTGCESGTCERNTGNCRCKAGWTGARCTQCGAGYYTDRRNCVKCGTGCESGTCERNTGNCRCKAGWTGARCSQCGAGYYTDRRNCVKCGTGCEPGTCERNTGNCRCKAGWTGARCTQCGAGYYTDRRNCVKCGTGCESGTCERNTGNCRCKAGWTGARCTRCASGKYGVDCAQDCSSGCETWGCNSSTGVCPDGRCNPGWTNTEARLQRCDQICSPWTYGENCLLDCSMGCVNQTCERTTGRCDVCLDGWEHEDLNITRCDKECDDSRYGENCKKDCSIHCINATCHHVNGSCTHGCLDGRSGEYCEVSEAGHQNVNLIVGLLLFLIVVIAVVMCVVFFRKPLRRLRDKKIEEGRTNGMNLPMAARGVQDASEHMAANDEDEAIYVNVPNSVPVAVSALKEFVARKKATKEILVKEYAELPKGLTAIHDKAVTQVNSPKNRFKGIYPYNHSLVVLKGNGGSSGYINASYIDGRTKGKQYIATQGPLPNTVVDFWKMIWQEQVPVIVMLANIMEDGRRRCEPYWPNEQGEDTKTFGPWKITVTDSCPLADFTIRTLTIKKGGMQRNVKHVHYMVWPDKDVPDNTMSLVELRNKVRTFCDFAQGPMVVHCSAGVGRTGTLIALDSLIEDAETRNMVDIYGCVWRLRNCRVSMVQTQSQYVFLHDCLLDALCHTVLSTPANLYGNAHQQLKKNSNLAVAYQKLCECPETDNVSDAARDLENIGKNRNKDILPGDKHRAILSTREAECTDYINAVIAPSYEKRRAFILTQIPLMSTVVDFWRLVHDYEVRGIVLLENYTDTDVKCGIFWAKDKKPTKFGPFSVSEGKIEEHNGFTMEKICYSLGNDEREVTVFRSPAWPKKSSLPESPSSLLSMIDFLRQWNAGTPSPLLVVCRDGATRSGLFCVVASAVQRLLLEKEVALQQTIRSIRFVRKQVIPNLKQFEFCYDSVKAYMDSFQEYSNFA